MSSEQGARYIKRRMDNDLKRKTIITWFLQSRHILKIKHGEYNNDYAISYSSMVKFDYSPYSNYTKKSGIITDTK